ncbi:MAG: hypothetical protein WBL45_04850 [Solirubrobacterales bacterium]
MLAAVLAASIAGCGSAPAEDKNAKQSLILIEDLPAGSAVKEEFPEPCPPEPILRERTKKFAATDPMGYKEVEVKEAIGIFSDTDKATEVYDSLTSTERSECIASAMKGFNPPEETIETGPVTSPDVAEEDWARRYSVINLSSETQGTLDAVALKSGVCVAALIFLARGEATEESVVDEVTEAAADRLPDSC